MPKILVEVRNLRKTYDTGETKVTPLDHINLDIAEGEFMSLMGPSGSGKTTLMNIVAGVDSATAGTVTVDGVDYKQTQRRQTCTLAQPKHRLHLPAVQPAASTNGARKRRITIDAAAAEYTT